MMQSLHTTPQPAPSPKKQASSIFHSPFSIFHSPFSIFRFPFSIFHSPFSILRFPLLIILLFAAPAAAQTPTYPVQVNVNLIPPYSLYLDDYAAGSRERLSVTLTNRDMQYPSMAVRLRLTIKGNGFSLQTNSYAAVAPIIIEPNQPYRLSQEELAPYLDPRNLTASGTGSLAWQKNRKLPEGMLEFCFEALEHHTNRKLSQPGCGMGWVVPQKPPTLSLPLNAETVAYRHPLNLLFQWTPRHSGLNNVEYEIIIKQLWDNGLKPEAAWAYSPEVLRQTLRPTSLLYGAALPPLTSGTRYAWAVRAVARQGIDELQVFENDGLSEIRWFELADHCPPPLSVTAKTDYGAISLEWTPLPEHLDFTVSYRRKGVEGADWFYARTRACRPGSPVYGPLYTISLPATDTGYDPRCGILPAVDVSNRDPLPVLAPGDTFTAGDFTVYVRQASGANGSFSGEGYTVLPTLLARAKLAVRWSNVFINTDRRMVVGRVDAVYDEGSGQVADLDDIFEGGSLVGQVKEGITFADIDLSFTIPEDASFVFNPNDNTITVTDGQGNEVGTIDMSHIYADKLAENGGKSVFPITVKDSQGNTYRIDDPAPADGSAPDGARPLTATAIGKAGAPIPDGAVDYTTLATDKATVRFEKSGRYAFDQWRSEYLTAGLIHKKYQPLGEGYVPYKLLPPGKTDEVRAVISLTDSSLDPQKVVFKTPTGTELSRGYSSADSSYTLSLAGGEGGDGLEVYALYPKGDGSYHNLGKLVVLSYPEQTYKLVVVPVNGATADAGGLKRELNRIYSPVGVSWSVTVADGFSYGGGTDFFEKGSGLLSAYTPAMRELQAAYAAAGNAIDPQTAYLFVLRGNGMGSNRNAAGFMPRGKQFGYLFTEAFSSPAALYTAAAHELGHGVFSLKHTFDSDYGLAQNATDNLMDYAGGSHLAKWQWDLMHDPGVVMRVFEKDEEAMREEPSTPKPPFKGTKEGQREVVETIFDQYGDEVVVSTTWYYHTWKVSPQVFTSDMGDPYPEGWYAEDTYAEIVKKALAGFALMTVQETEGSPILAELPSYKEYEYHIGYLTELLASPATDVDGLAYLLESHTYVGYDYLRYLNYLKTGHVKPVNIEFELIFTFKTLGAGKLLSNVFQKFERGTINRVSAASIRQWMAGFLGKGRVLKVGDEIAGIKIVRIRYGTNGKVAIIGLNMSKRVEPFADALKKLGYEVELFNGIYQKNFIIAGRKYSWQEIVDDLTGSNPIFNYQRDLNGFVINADIEKTLMYKANKQFAERLVRENYTVVGLDLNSTSLWYNMEVQIIFK